MQHAAAQLVARYRIILQCEEQEFVATIAEVPSVRARAARASDAIQIARAAATATIAPLLDEGTAPTPLRDSEGPLGAWMQELETPVESAAAPAGMEKPSPEALRSIADWMAGRYRMLLEENDVYGFAATCREFPESIAHGTDACSTVQSLQRQLSEMVYDLLDSNRVPPEPLRDVEARQALQPRPQATTPAVVETPAENPVVVPGLAMPQAA
jgi:predicted RNase H-like HicB family nuclease